MAHIEQLRFAMDRLPRQARAQLCYDATGLTQVDAQTLSGLLHRAKISAGEVLEYLPADRVTDVAARRRARVRKRIIDRLFGDGPAAAPAHPPFVAIDFETGDHQRDSAISVAVVRVERGQVVHRFSSLIRPLRPAVHPRMTSIHGLSYEDVARAPTFDRVHAQLATIMRGARYIVAHNAPFDRSVYERTAAAHGFDGPGLPWVCTVNASRALLPVRRAKLPTVAAHLGIALQHHDAASDAACCGEVAVALWLSAPNMFERFTIERKEVPARVGFFQKA